MTVLIVEDNLISAKVLAHTLGKGGYKTMTAKDGKQGLECLESHPDVELIITDMLMPRIDGAQFIRKLRERNEWIDIPVLVCTSLTTSAVNKLIPEHNWKFMMKPIRGETLISNVKELLASRIPVLQNPLETMRKMGLEPEAFFTVAGQFLKLVKDKIDLLEDHIRRESNDEIELKSLREGAALLRAERVTHILDRLPQDIDGMTEEAERFIFCVLLRELKALHQFLLDSFC